MPGCVKTSVWWRDWHFWEPFSENAVQGQSLWMPPLSQRLSEPESVRIAMTAKSFFRPGCLPHLSIGDAVGKGSFIARFDAPRDGSLVVFRITSKQFLCVVLYGGLVDRLCCNINIHQGPFQPPQNDTTNSVHWRKMPATKRSRRAPFRVWIRWWSTTHQHSGLRCCRRCISRSIDRHETSTTSNTASSEW